MQKAESSLRIWPGLAIALAMISAILPPPLLSPGGPLYRSCLLGAPLVFVVCSAVWLLARRPAPRVAVVAAALGSVALVAAVVAASSRFHFGNLTAVRVASVAGLAVWWIAASRAPARERLVVVAGFVLAWLLARWIGHPSIPFVLVELGLPIALAIAVMSLAAFASCSSGRRQVATLVALFTAWGAWCLVRCDGVDGLVNPSFSWRWAPTAEQRFLADLDTRTAIGTVPQVEPLGDTARVSSPEDWPAFRGARRDSRVEEGAIRTDWDVRPPLEVWRRSIGPGWSSFSLVGQRLYTQEQRGDNEHVVCYDADSGDEIWTHSDPARFYEVMGGVGPRATPTFHEGHLYALGAMGTLNCLDAATGTTTWSRNIAADTDTQIPKWGFASSPLVVDSVVIVFAGGEGKNGVLAYDAQTGDPVWAAGAGHLSYSSPQWWQEADTEQVLMASDTGMVSLSPRTGQQLWSHAWPWRDNARVVQPHPVGAHRVLISTGVDMGTRMLEVHHQQESEWSVEEVWTSIKLKPVFNDFVTHKGAIYGFDGRILTSVDLETGARNWKEGRYGTGQLLLIAPMNVLVVLAENGEIVLVDADPTAHRERARFQALTGKTWNHPVFSRGRLYLRNAEEAACFDVSP